MRDLPRLVGPSLRVFALETVRGHRALIPGVLVGVMTLQAVLVLRARAAGVEPPNLGVLAQLGVLVLTVPLCRSWVDDDVRLGYGVFWLQKPVTHLGLYGARALAAVLGALAVGVSVWLATFPAFVLTGAAWTGYRDILLLTAWLPVLLVVLSFTGSAAGARNGAVFAYGILVIGFGFAGLAEALGLTGTALDRVLRLALPPVSTMAEMGIALRERGLVAGMSRTGPLVLYLLAVAGLGLALVGRIPGRLARRA